MNGYYTPMGAAIGCPSPGYGYGYALAPYTNYDIIGQTAADAAQPSLLDKIKAKGEEETFGIKNKYLAGGALAIGAIALASSYGYFDRRGRRR